MVAARTVTIAFGLVPAGAIAIAFGLLVVISTRTIAVAKNGLAVRLGYGVVWKGGAAGTITIAGESRRSGG